MNQKHLVPEEGVAQLLRASSLRSWRLLLSDLMRLHRTVSEDDEEELLEASARRMTLEEIATHTGAHVRDRDSVEIATFAVRNSEADAPRSVERSRSSRGGVSVVSGSVSSSPKRIAVVDREATPGSRVLRKWLEGLGIDFDDNLDGSVLPSFRDGLLLCRLIERLDPTVARGGIRGLERRPKAGAACLQNIRLALRVLRKRKTMPMDYLWSEQKIRAGDGETIRGMLMQIRKAYGHHFPRRRRRAE